LAGGILADALDVDVGDRVLADVDLGSLGSFLEHLQAVLVEPQIDAVLLEEVSASQVMMRSSKSSPPRYVSPAVESTSKTSLPISRMEMSKVPPPRSYTAIFCVISLPNP